MSGVGLNVYDQQLAVFLLVCSGNIICCVPGISDELLRLCEVHVWKSSSVEHPKRRYRLRYLEYTPPPWTAQAVGLLNG